MGNNKSEVATGAILVSPPCLSRDGGTRSWLGTLEALARNYSSLASIGGELLMLWPKSCKIMVTPGADAYALM